MTQSDIQHLINSTSPGVEVVIPPGTYLISAPIFPLAGQTLRCKSIYAVILRKAPAYSGPIIEVNANGVGVRYLDLQGNYPLASGSGIYAHDVHDFFVRDCRISYMESSGIVMTNTSRSRISYNTLNRCGTGSISGAPAIFANFFAIDHIVEHNLVQMTPLVSPHGIGYHTEGVGARIRQISITDNVIINQGGGYCIEVGSFASGGGDPERPTSILILNNMTSQSANCSGGISFDWVRDAIVRGNIHRSSGGTANAGIECVNGRSVRIESNEVYGARLISIGIAIDHDGADIQVLGNTIAEILETSQGNYIACRAIGEFVEGPAGFRNLTISGNMLDAPHGGDGTGIRILLETDPAQFIENVRIENNVVKWTVAGGGNSAAVTLGALAENTHMTDSIVLNNTFENTHFGAYFQGFGDLAPSYGLNDMTGVSIPYHID